MSKYGNLFTEETLQSVPIEGREAEMTPNNAGGFTFILSPWARLERFLILGSDSNTYYQTAKKLTIENAKIMAECWNENPARTATVIRTISLEGRAARNSPAIFATALGVINPSIVARQEAFKLIPSVCRTSTHLFEFVSTAKQLGKGWGRGMARAVANWYSSKTDDQLAYQLIKYRQREGYTHERLIRLSHPGYWDDVKATPAKAAMYDWLRGRNIAFNPKLPKIINAHEMWKLATEEEATAMLPSLKVYNLPWEALPTWALSKPEIWKAMLPKMPLTAMMRNLGNMTRLGVFKGEYPHFDPIIISAIAKLTDIHELRKARLHPFNILNAYSTYSSGEGFRNTWTANPFITNSLERAFYNSFKTIIPSNKRIMLALDVSGSMTNAKLMRSNLSAREASAAMAMATLRSEERVEIVGFTSLHAHNYANRAIAPLAINRNDTLKEIVDYTFRLPFSGTDCSLPMLYAMQERMKIDAFIIYTDNETWAGRIHPSEALRRYRRESGIEDAKLVVVGMTSTGFTIADPNDPNMLDVVGFDSDAPAIIADFIRGGGQKETREFSPLSNALGYVEEEEE